MAWYHLQKGAKTYIKIYKLKECEEYLLLDAWDRLIKNGLHKGCLYDVFEKRYIENGGRLTSKYHRLIFCTLRDNSILHYLPSKWVDGDADKYVKYTKSQRASHRQYILSLLNNISPQERDNLIKQKEFEVRGLASKPAPLFQPDDFDALGVSIAEDVEDEDDPIEDAVFDDVKKTPNDMAKHIESKLNGIMSQADALQGMLDQLNTKITSIIVNQAKSSKI